MRIIVVVLVVLCIVSVVYSYVNNINSIISQKSSSINKKIMPIVSKGVQRGQPLYLDFFGLGPSEFVIIIVASAVLFGPDRIKSQLRNSGVKGEFVSSGWQAERKERIEELEKRAYAVRKARLFNRLDKEQNEE